VVTAGQEWVEEDKKKKKVPQKFGITKKNIYLCTVNKKISFFKLETV
jgi:hypothetical protein